MRVSFEQNINELMEEYIENIRITENQIRIIFQYIYSKLLILEYIMNKFWVMPN